MGNGSAQEADTRHSPAIGYLAIIRPSAQKAPPRRCLAAATVSYQCPDSDRRHASLWARQGAESSGSRSWCNQRRKQPLNDDKKEIIQDRKDQMVLCLVPEPRRRATLRLRAHATPVPPAVRTVSGSLSAPCMSPAPSCISTTCMQ
jgi:hypothetical protein